MSDGDLVLKRGGGTITVVSNFIHNWTTAFILYMDILLKKWPSKAKEYLKYMHNIRLEGNNPS
jgi:hypothetical protein